MSDAWFQLRAAGRARWRAWIAVGVLIGIAAGVVMTAVAGARRTDSSLDRVVVDSRAADVLVNPNNGTFAASRYRQLERLPEVARFSLEVGAPMVPLDARGRPNLRFIESARGTVVIGSPDGAELRSIDRAAVVSGRMPAPDDANALVINETAEKLDHLHVGSHLRVAFFDAAAAGDPSAGVPELHDRTTLTVAAIVRPLDDATRAPDDPRLSPFLYLSRSLSRRTAPLGSFYSGISVQLHARTQLARFERDARRIAGGNVLSFEELGSTLQRARRALRPYVVALWTFAGLALLAGMAVVAQIAIRQQRLEGTARPILRALGATRRDLMRVGLLRGAFIGTVAGAVAAITAVFGSLLMPIGPLRVLEPHRGIDVDVTVVVASVIAILVLVALQSALAAGRAPRRRSAHPVRWAERATRSTSSPAVAAGLRFVFDTGSGDTSVPVRSTTFGVGLAVAALVATLVFASGLERFTSTPRRYGWIWSYQVEYAGSQTAASLDTVSDRLARDPRVRAAATGAYAQLGIEGTTVAAIAVEAGRGVPVAQMVTGRAPRATDEVALGAETLRSLDHEVGDRIAISIGGVTRRFRVVGQAVFPRFAPYPASVPTGLGAGAALTLSGLRRFGALDSSVTSPVAGSPFLLLDTQPGTTAATVEHLAFPDDPSQGLVLGAQRPNYVVSYQHLERTPLALAALLILLALATTLHLLVSMVRRRRRDLGTLRALGFTARQMRGALLVQATTLIGFALVVAIPIGIVAGRLLWSLTAHWLGIAVDNVVPVATIVAVAAIALVVGNATALIPAAAAARVSAAESLRRE